MQLVERLLPTPEIHGENPVTGDFIYNRIYYKNCIEKTKIKRKKRPGMAELKKYTRDL